MQKIPTMFERDWAGDRSKVLDIPHPACAWVFAGEGIALRKLDGTSCMIREERLFKRREIKAGQALPSNFELVSTDEETGKTIGWVPVGDGPEDQYHREAFSKQGQWTDGTYELIGPRIQGNPEGAAEHTLVRHAEIQSFPSAPRTFAELREWLSTQDIEGIVFHHPDGRMAKIKLRDFGLLRMRSPGDTHDD